jgi:SAM-dependent methyltransferase
VNKSPTTRFSDRVADYVKYRPSYPSAAIDAVVKTAKLTPGARVADIGSGTGISAALLLARGHEVYAVEPNREMRAAAEDALAWQAGFHSVEGTAEHTGLGDALVVLATAAQSFHWFQREEAKVELRRVVAAPHRFAVLWNERLTDTAFLQDYEAALHTHSPDYADVNHRNIDREEIAGFFKSFETFTFPNAQRFDRDGFLGRARSSSYVPKTPAMTQVLEALFSRHELDGEVEFRYLTSVHVGTV